MGCPRCRGYMIRDSFVDLKDDTGHIRFEGWRCINCGEVLDPVVLAHRTEMPTFPYRGRTRDRRTWKWVAPEQLEQSGEPRAAA